MATIASLIVKIGARDEEITQALEKLGSNAKKTDAELKKLGNTPLAKAAQTSLEELDKTLKGVTDGQQRLADRAKLAAQGLTSMGGPARLTRTELEQINRTLQTGLDAFRALGQQAPKDLQKVATAAQQQLKALEGVNNNFGKLSDVAGLATTALGALGIGLSVGAVVGFGKSILADADALVKMHDKTGISTQGLQKFQIAGDDAGNTIEQLAAATNQMQNRLAGNDKSALAAIDKLGISLTSLRAQAPDQQFMTIADAIRQIQDPAEQVNVAMDIFGKQGAEVLPTIKRGFDDVKDASVGMSDHTVKALDKVGDALQKTLREMKGQTAEFIAAILPGLQHAVFLFNILSGRGGQQVVDAVTPDLKNPKPAGSPNFGTAPTLFPNFVAPNLATADMFSGRLDKDLAPILSAQKKSAEEAAAALKKVHDAEEAAAQKMLEMGFATRDSAKAMSELGHVGVQSAGLITDGLGQALLKMQAFTAIDTSKLKFDLGAFFDTGHVKTPSMDDFKPIGKTLTATFQEAFKSLPNVLVSSFTGGGGLKGAANAFGSILGSSLFSVDQIDKQSGKLIAAGGKIGNAISKILPKAFSDAVPVIGALIGPAIQGLVGLFKKIGGPSQAELGARKTQDDLITKLKGIATQGEITEGALTDNYHTIAIVARDAFIKSGLSAEQATLKVKGLLDTHNPAAFQKAMEEVNGVLAAAAEKEALVARLTGNQEAATAGVNSAMEKWKLTINDLGPAFKQQNLDQMAGALFQDFSLLTTAGGDTVQVLDHMKGGFQDLVTQSLETGSKIPENLKPAIQTLIDMGGLTDTAGQKLTSIDQLQFGKSLDTKFDILIGKIGDLVDALKFDLTGAINGLPDHTIHIGTQIDDPGFVLPNELRRPVPNTASTGGLVTAAGIQHFAGGGRVLPFLRRGTDTVPAMLTPGEVVLNQSQQADLRQREADTPVPATFIIQIDGHEFMNIFVDNVRRDTAGVRRVIKRVAS